MLAATEKKPITTTKAVLSYAIVALFLFFEMGVQVSPSVMTSALMHDLNIGALGLGLMSGFYFYTYTIMQVPSGLLFDRFRPRYVITVSILVCSLGCLAFGLATNIYLGTLARLLMGFGSAFAFVAVLVVTADLFDNRHFALITGITQMLAAFGAMAGQMPLSFAVDHLGWRVTLFMLFGIGIVLAFFVWIFLNYKKDLLHLKGSQQTEKPKLSNILKNWQTWSIAAYACLLWAPMSGFASLWGVPYLRHVFDLPRTTAALVCSMMWLGLALLSPVLGYLSTQFRSRVWPLAISALVGVISFGLLLLLKSTSVGWIMLLLFFAGASCAGQALSFTVVKEINDKVQRGTAIAVNNMAVVISGALFQPLLGKLLSFHCEGEGSSFAICQAYHYKTSMLLILGVYVLASLLAIFFIRESYTT